MKDFFARIPKYSIQRILKYMSFVTWLSIIHSVSNENLVRLYESLLELKFQSYFHDKIK